ncbi:response regulator [Lysinibacter cavernae]|uniref:Transcriptional regulatory protein n=1 Tax=Lysinibacter cavernae TaxID=1640652 RepID=A0A7X5R0N3_9MICO|nr:response regulator [Lysinibacter cavernae]NIH53434.1 response regulator of citrate/malate metabolism [Lysinibacter cavernae]
MTQLLRVLIVEDEPTTAEAHAAYVTRVPGFTVVGVAHSGLEALGMLSPAASLGVDVVLLDMNLPDMSGIEVARRIRAASLRVDIIAVTAVRELETVRASISFGVMQYILKPFSFAAFAEKLARYRQFAAELTGELSAVGTQQEIVQGDIDAALSALRTSGNNPLPKGLSPETLSSIVGYLRSTDAAVSAGELTEAVAVSRITARRYLEYLTSTRQVSREPRYGTPGRPELEYRWED